MMNKLLMPWCWRWHIYYYACQRIKFPRLAFVHLCFTVLLKEKMWDGPWALTSLWVSILFLCSFCHISLHMNNIQTHVITASFCVLWVILCSVISIWDTSLKQMILWYLARQNYTFTRLEITAMTSRQEWIAKQNRAERTEKKKE